MEEEQSGDSPISSKGNPPIAYPGLLGIDSQSNESTKAENMLGITDKSLQRNVYYILFTKKYYLFYPNSLLIMIKRPGVYTT